MAIETSLIKGAEFAATGGSPTGGYIDPAEYLYPGIKKFTDQIEAGIKKSEDAYASLMDDFDSYVDLSRFSDNQLSAAKNWLVDKKRKYSDIASRLSKMQRTNPKYSELTDELNRIQGAINTFAQQKKAYIANRIQMKDSDFDEYSRVDPKQVENFTSMYGNGAGFTIDETGNMIFKGIDGEDMPFYLSKEPDKKAQDEASAITKIADDIITKAYSGKKIDQDLINLKLDAIIKNSQQARSLLQDGVLSDTIINIPEDFKLEKDDKAVVDQTKNLLAKSLMDTYSEKYKPNIENTKSRKPEPKTELQTQLINVVKTQVDKKLPIIIKDRIKLQPSNNGYQVLEYEKDKNKWRSTDRLVKYNEALNFWMQYKF
jgi:hypothetical protein